MSRGKRYDTEPKLNIKKVIAVIIAIAVIIMFIIGIKTLLTTNTQENVEINYYYPVYTNQKWGVINQKGDIIVEPTKDEIITIPDSKQEIFICIENVDYNNGNYKTKVLNSNNQEIFTNYDTVEAIENNDKNSNLWYEQGVLKVKKENKYGLIDFSGKEILPLEYQEIKALSGVKNSLLIKKDDKLGLCDNSGIIIIPTNYKEIKPIEQNYQNGYIVVNDQNKYGVIDFNKVTILEPKYEDIKQVKGNNIYIIKENGNYKAINKEGQTLLENKFDNVTQINEDNLVIVRNGKYGVINTKQEEKIKAEYEELSYLYDEYYLAKKDGKYGIIDLSQKTVLKFDYTKIAYQKEVGIIQLEKDNKNTEIYNTKLEKKLEGIVEKVDIENSYLKIRLQDGIHYYNFKLEEKPLKELLKDKQLFVSKKDGKYGYVNKKEEVIVDYIYEEAMEFNEHGYAAVKKDGKWGAINEKAEQTSECKYELEDNIIVDFISKWHLGQDLNSYYYTDK